MPIVRHNRGHFPCDFKKACHIQWALNQDWSMTKIALKLDLNVGTVRMWRIATGTPTLFLSRSRALGSAKRLRRNAISRLKKRLCASFLQRTPDFGEVGLDWGAAPAQNLQM